MKIKIILFVMFGLVAIWSAQAAETPPAADPAKVEFQWGQKIPLRDGVKLNATVYRPRAQSAALPCVFTLTPYIGQSYHDRGLYFASNGYVFLTVDVRGRGNSEGEFTPLLQEARDGYDVVEWLAKQSYCNGKVSMWGGSYAGYDQWATAKEFPPHLASIVPVASPYAGVDFPMQSNMFYPYDIQWLTLTAGRTSQSAIFGDSSFWASAFRRMYVDHQAFRSLDRLAGMPSPIFQEWLQHPQVDAYWDSFNPTAGQYAKLDLPILTITGMYDGDQPGALTHYRLHQGNASAAARARHYLIIGPWDHAGTRTPTAEVGGVKFAAASMLDMNKLHREWYDWTLKSGSKPEFLKDAVAYYVTGADRWRYAGSLDKVSGESRPYYLDSVGGRANDVFASGSLARAKPAAAGEDDYRYDPLDVESASLFEDDKDPQLTDQRGVLLNRGNSIIYHTPVFDNATEVSGFFRLSAWLAIDQPDTDFEADVYEIKADGSSVYLSGAAVRARYRESLREARPVPKNVALPYEFERFTFVSREIAKGSRLRLVIGPINGSATQKNYNSGGVVADETARDARTVRVRLLHGGAHPSALYVPIAAQ